MITSIYMYFDDSKSHIDTIHIKFNDDCQFCVHTHQVVMYEMNGTKFVQVELFFFAMECHSIQYVDLNTKLLELIHLQLM